MLLYVNPLAGTHAPQPGAIGTGAGSERERTALKELEHYFAFTLLQEMRKSVPKTGLLDGGQAQQIYDEMLDDALSGSMAESGQLGVSRMLEQQLRLAELQKKIHKSFLNNGAKAETAETAGLEPLK